MRGVPEVRLKTITAPTESPVSFDLAKEHIRVDTSDEDATIDVYRLGAIRYTERALERTLLDTTYELYLDTFAPCIELPRPPLIEVLAIEYVDPDGVTQTVPAADYDTETNVEPGRVELVSTASWPAHKAVRNAVTIRYRAGWLNPLAIPQNILGAILMLTDHWFTRRAPVELVERGRLEDVPLSFHHIVALEGVTGAQ